MQSNNTIFNDTMTTGGDGYYLGNNPFYVPYQPYIPPIFPMERKETVIINYPQLTPKLKAISIIRNMIKRGLLKQDMKADELLDLIEELEKDLR